MKGGGAGRFIGERSLRMLVKKGKKGERSGGEGKKKKRPRAKKAETVKRKKFHLRRGKRRGKIRAFDGRGGGKRPWFPMPAKAGVSVLVFKISSKTREKKEGELEVRVRGGREKKKGIEL